MRVLNLRIYWEILTQIYLHFARQVIAHKTEVNRPRPPLICRAPYFLNRSHRLDRFWPIREHPQPSAHRIGRHGIDRSNDRPSSFS